MALKEALLMAHKTSPDVVVMDVNMPVMNGIDATKKLKQKMPHVRVIAL
ncbi:MAG: response regulator [Balneolaceae bacterium]